MTGPAGAGRPRGVLPRAGRRILFPGAQARNVTDSQLSWRDPALAGVAVLTAVLELLALGRLEGYQLADAVEYMDRAAAVLEGRGLDPGTRRSFAFSGLLLPLFAAAERWPALDPVLASRAVAMAAGLASVLVTARLGARLWGRSAGVAAGLLLACNPVFLHYAAVPLPATAA